MVASEDGISDLEEATIVDFMDCQRRPAVSGAGRLLTFRLGGGVCGGFWAESGMEMASRRTSAKIRFNILRSLRPRILTNRSILCQNFDLNSGTPSYETGPQIPRDDS
jgi:hypothetical protein